MDTNVSYRVVEKEYIDQIQFGSDDVLETEEAKADRTKQLQKAQELGNLHKHHVRIRFFNDKAEALETTVTIWAVTKNHVVLKGEKLIPITSICHLKLY